MTNKKKPEAEMLITEDLGIEVYPCTQRLLDEAARTADLPIVITTDQQRTVGSFRLASKDRDYHEINVDTSAAFLSSLDRANYVLAHEATHAIRAFTLPPEQRRVVTCHDAKDALKVGLALTMKAVEQGVCADLDSALEFFYEWECEMQGYLGGPEEIEVDNSVWQQCPELRDAKAKMTLEFQRSVDYFLNGNSPFWEPLTSVMCATIFPQLWVAGGLIGRKLTRVFYNYPDAFNAGKQLLAIVQQKEPDHLGDIQAEEQWIEALGLGDIFRLVAPSELSGYDESSYVDFEVTEDGELVIVG